MALSSHYFIVCILTVTCTITTYFIFNEGIFNCERHVSENQKHLLERPGPYSEIEEPIRKEDGTRNCKSCFGKVPNYIVQYGHPRTATTLQFQILCLSMAFLHQDEIHSLGCYFTHKKVYKYTVLKTHNIDQILKTIPSNSWIFMTSNNALSSDTKHEMNLNIQKIKSKNITIPYTADVDQVSVRGHSIVYEYQHIFGLSDEQIQYIVEYIRYWDILRVCCGVQMSEDWRNHLSPKANYKQHHGPHSPTYPACEMYNISQVEKLLINTYAFKKFGPIHNIGRPSGKDGKVDGNYCERCNANISERHLIFNQRCV